MWTRVSRRPDKEKKGPIHKRRTVLLGRFGALVFVLSLVGLLVLISQTMFIVSSGNYQSEYDYNLKLRSPTLYAGADFKNEAAGPFWAEMYRTISNLAYALLILNVILGLYFFIFRSVWNNPKTRSADYSLVVILLMSSSFISYLLGRWVVGIILLDFNNTLMGTDSGWIYVEPGPALIFDWALSLILVLCCLTYLVATRETDPGRKKEFKRSWKGPWRDPKKWNWDVVLGIFVMFLILSPALSYMTIGALTVGHDKKHNSAFRYTGPDVIHFTSRYWYAPDNLLHLDRLVWSLEIGIFVLGICAVILFMIFRARKPRADGRSSIAEANASLLIVALSIFVLYLSILYVHQPVAGSSSYVKIIVGPEPWVYLFFASSMMVAGINLSRLTMKVRPEIMEP